MLGQSITGAAHSTVCSDEPCTRSIQKAWSGIEEPSRCGRDYERKRGCEDDWGATDGRML